MKNSDEESSEPASDISEEAFEAALGTRSLRRSPVGRLLNKREMADFLGLSLGQLDSLIRVGLPYESRGDGKIRGRDSNAEWRFASARVVQWLRDTDKQQVHDMYDGDGEDEMLKRLHPDDPRYEERVTVAAIRRLELVEKQGKTLLVEDVTRIIAEEYAVVRARLMAIPGRVIQEIVGLLAPHTVEPAKIERLLKTEVSSALATLSADAAQANEQESESESENDPGF